MTEADNKEPFKEEWAETPVDFPPKYTPAPQSENLWRKSAISLLLYMAVGYFFFQDYKTLLLITAVVMIHELGHFLAMKWYKYSDVGIFFIPLLGAYVSGAKREVSQKQSAVIILAGPLPGIVIGVLLIMSGHQNPFANLFGISYFNMGLIFLLLNIVNLLPVYPLDGGQLLNRVFLDEESMVSKIFVIISALLMCWFVWVMFQRNQSPTIFVFLIFPVNMLLKHLGGNKLARTEKRIEEAGINTDVDYADLPDEDYWKIRDIVIDTQPGFSGFTGGQPYTYQVNEEKMMQMVQLLLHRNLIQDVSFLGKAILLIIWLAAFAAPWFLHREYGLFERWI